MATRRCSTFMARRPRSARLRVRRPIELIARGGAGGHTGEARSSARESLLPGGRGGSGGDVTAQIYGTIQSRGNGLSVYSIGGDGGASGTYRYSGSTNVAGGAGGSGGAGGPVSIITYEASQIATSGAGSLGIEAVSLGGAGQNGGDVIYTAIPGTAARAADLAVAAAWAALSRSTMAAASRPMAISRMAYWRARSGEMPAEADRRQAAMQATRARTVMAAPSRCHRPG